MRRGGKDGDEGCRVTLLSTVRSKIGFYEEIADYELMPADAFQEYVLRAYELKEDPNNMEFLECLRIIQNQVGYPDEGGVYHAHALALHPLCVWMLDHMNDSHNELALPYIIHIFVDMMVLTSCFRSRLVLGDSRDCEIFIERVHHVAQMFPSSWNDIVYIFFYNIFSFRPSGRFAEYYTKELLTTLDIRNPDDMSCFWMPLMLASLLKESRLSYDANTVFILKMTEIVRFTESEEHRRACMWCIYFWMKLGAIPYETEVKGDIKQPETLDEEGMPIRETKIVKVTVVNQLTHEFIKTMHQMLRSSDLEIVTIALHVISTIWAVKFDERVERSLLKKAKIPLVVSLVTHEDTTVSTYALIWFANMIARENQNGMDWWLAIEELPELLTEIVINGFGYQKECAMRLLAVVLHRAPSDDIMRFFTPELAIELTEMVDSFSRDIGVTILSLLLSVLPKVPQCIDLFLEIGFDEKLENMCEQDDYLDMEEHLLEILTHRRKVLEEGEPAEA